MSLKRLKNPPSSIFLNAASYCALSVSNMSASSKSSRSVVGTFLFHALNIFCACCDISSPTDARLPTKPPTNLPLFTSFNILLPVRIATFVASKESSYFSRILGGFTFSLRSSYSFQPPSNKPSNSVSSV